MTLAQVPVWLLWSEDDEVVASIRAKTPENAREAFRKAGMKGAVICRSYEEGGPDRRKR